MTYQEAFTRIVNRVRTMEHNSKRRNSYLEELDELAKGFEDALARVNLSGGTAQVTHTLVTGPKTFQWANREWWKVSGAVKAMYFEVWHHFDAANELDKASPMLGRFLALVVALEKFEKPE